MEKARKERGENLLAACAAACLSLLLGLIEYVTRFATVRAAITGEAFFAAGRNVVNLLRRNFMDAFGVWWVRKGVVGGACAWGSGGPERGRRRGLWRRGAVRLKEAGALSCGGTRARCLAPGRHQGSRTT